MKELDNLKRGEICWCDLPVIPNSSIQHGIHPCVIIQNNVGNKFSPNAVVVAFTSRKTKSKIATHIKWHGCLEKESTLQCEQVLTIPKTCIAGRIGLADDYLLRNIDRCLKIEMGLK